ncbi:carbohydrate kinase family protein [Agrobacterium rubi]|uniref:Carbohydrate kinase family protein n=1 Tax=Agrobacterium rubi TaxID=28099 RepID=A0AAE7UR30_9HYPH|nr:carbohydrate kinase family protein [Agrobacterium rubi]NTE88368.1 carbohydrate kinase family protein [Agrobacterium rubi]NTF04134.1 carbohydrate kinase family protein [Agrobacterium rubi]NTF09548.1 carbohydrate kinase family protein [Agrobacterium rubi]NTF22455.1 carbohydrate kinase family protein [Agrobacterium rubi]NTF29312.1 carbohydrate kinase family protein [Agrobacterium rubi]
MSSIVVTGYASLDHVIMLDGDVRAGCTTTILSRHPKAWPRLGGGPAYVTQSVARSFSGFVAPISWIGGDGPGDLYLDQLRDGGVYVNGIAKVDGARTPVSVLAYDPHGDCAVLYDPGLPPSIGLTDTQRALIRSADWIGITIGPKIVTDELLDIIRPEQKLAWVVKNDPRAITPEQVAALAIRADLIFCNGRESTFLDSTREGIDRVRKDQILVETQGRLGAGFIRGSESRFVAAEPVDVTDPTGAGDTFAGGVIAAIMNGEKDLDVIGHAGNAAARKLLLERKSEETES